MRRAALDLVFGLVLLAIGGFLFWETMQPKYADTMGLGVASDPAFYPQLLLSVWLLVAAILVLRALRDHGVGRIESQNWAGLFGIVLLTGAYVWLMGRIGFLFASISFVLAAALALGYRRAWIALLIAVGFPALVWYLFVFVLQITLPFSPWFDRI